MPRLETADHAPRTRTGRRSRLRVSSSLAEINVVPLVDVMLVLLVIFMVTAPMMQQGYAVNLPKVKRAPALNAEPIYVTVPARFHSDSRVQIGKDWVSLAVLHERARQELEGRTTKDVYLRADDSVSYGDVMRVMQELNLGGAEHVALLTQPPTSEK